MNRLKRTFQDESGSVTVIVAISLSLLLLCGAFVVDLGQARQRARQQQASADAGATAGAVGLPSSASAAPSAYKYAAEYAFRTLTGGSAPVAGCALAPPAEVPAGATQCYVAAGGKTIVYVTTPWGPDQVYNPAISAPAPNQIRVKVCTDVKTGLARIIGITNIRPCRIATAINTSVETPFQCALCVMRTSGNDTLKMSADANVNVGGNVVVNSNGATAARVTGNGSLRATGPITTRHPTGGWTKEGNGAWCGNGVTPCPPPSPPGNPQPGAPLIQDPLGWLGQPGAPPTDNFCKMPLPGICNSMNVTNNQIIWPGIWSCITINGGNLTLMPGLYVFRGCGIKFDSAGSITGHGVTLYFACNSYPGPCSGPPETGSRLTMTSDGSLTVCAPGNAASSNCPATAPADPSDPTTGINKMAIFFDRGNRWLPQSNPGIQISANGNLNVTGTIYALNAYVQMSGNGAARTLNSAVVVDTIELSGNGGLAVNFDPNQNVLLNDGIALIT